MGSDELFKKRRAARKKRQYEYRTPRANSYLIVTEGEKTEPLYFAGLKKEIEEGVGGHVDIVEKPLIEIHGEGCATKSLLEAAEQAVKNATIFYQNVWIVFDKDDFPDFDQAIENGSAKGYHIAWSNQSFEYWLYLHFEYSDSALSRNEWTRKLNEIFRRNKLGDGEYRKNYEDIYYIVDTFDGVNTAIRNAKRRMSSFQSERAHPSGFDPGTTVYQLVEELRKYIYD